MENLSIIERIYLEENGDPDLLSMFKSEAAFGLSEISPWIKEGVACLEVGAGTGYLSLMIAELGAEVDALEPGLGFTRRDDILSLIEKYKPKNVKVIRESIENYAPDKKYDLVFSINAFEHFSDWKFGIKKIHDLLREGGSAIVLCPNYGFPYESHFGIPVIFDKFLTEKIFRKRISKFEIKNDCVGLWNGLNFISASEVKNYCKKEKIVVQFDRNIFYKMLFRVIGDDNFYKRQGKLSKLVKVFLYLKLHPVVKLLPIRYRPYMMFRITR